jgi:hypothetical protein
MLRYGTSLILRCQSGPLTLGNFVRGLVQLPSDDGRRKNSKKYKGAIIKKAQQDHKGPKQRPNIGHELRPIGLAASNEPVGRRPDGHIDEEGKEQ